MEVNKNAELNKVCGIKCDAKGCDYCDPTVLIEELEDWLNKPCPKCNANLLTEEDFAMAEGMQAMVEMLNDINPSELEGIKKALPNLPEFNESVTITIDPKGLKVVSIEKDID